MFQNYIPRANIPVARESSPLLSPRESGQRGQLWKYVRDNAHRGEKLTNGLAVAQRAIEQMYRRNRGLSVFHPFKIYPPSNSWPNSNSAWVITNTTGSDHFWRTFRVRNGLVLTTTVLGLQIEGGGGQYGVKGCDQCDLPYDENWMYRGDQVTFIPNVPEIVVPENTANWVFWVEVYVVSGTNYAVLRYAADPDGPPSDHYTDPTHLNADWDSTNPWTGYPSPDSTHFVIGLVDTVTLNQQAIVRQLLTTDILASGGSAGTTCPYG